MSTPEEYYNNKDHELRLRFVTNSMYYKEMELEKDSKRLERTALEHEVEHKRVMKELLHDIAKSYKEEVLNREQKEFLKVLDARSKKLRDFVDTQVVKYVHEPINEGIKPGEKGFNPIDPERFRGRYQASAKLSSSPEKDLILANLLPPELVQAVNQYIAEDNKKDGLWDNIGISFGLGAVTGGLVGGISKKSKKGAIGGAAIGGGLSAAASLIPPVNEKMDESKKEIKEAWDAGKKQQGEWFNKNTFNNAAVFGMGAYGVAAIAFGADKPLKTLTTAGIAAGVASMPAIVLPVMKIVEAGAEITGTGIYHGIGAVKNTMYCITHGNLDNAKQLVDGKRKSLRLREEIAADEEEYLRTHRPTNVSEALHERIWNREKGIERAPLTMEEIKEAALFCVRAIDPAVMVTGEVDLSAIKYPDPNEGWSPRTVALLQRSFATLEARMMWDYFMLEAAHEEGNNKTELGWFIEHFYENLMEKRKQQEMNPEELASHLENNESKLAFGAKELKKMFPEADIVTLDEKQVEGIHNLMKEFNGGDILTIILMAYGIGEAFYFLRTLGGDEEKTKELTTTKYEKNWSKAKDNVVFLLKDKKMPWNDILKNLEKMSVIYPQEASSLRHQNVGIGIARDMFGRMKKDKEYWSKLSLKTGKGHLTQVKKMQERFRKYLPKTGIRKNNILPHIGKTTGGRDEMAKSGIVRQVTDIKPERDDAVDDLKKFIEIRDTYKKYRSERTAVYQEDAEWYEFLTKARNLKKKAPQAFKDTDEFLHSKEKSVKLRGFWNMLSEKGAVIERMKILGVPENEIKYLKSLSNKDGLRTKKMYEWMEELVDIYK